MAAALKDIDANLNKNKSQCVNRRQFKVKKKNVALKIIKEKIVRTRLNKNVRRKKKNRVVYLKKRQKNKQRI